MFIKFTLIISLFIFTIDLQAQNYLDYYKKILEAEEYVVMRKAYNEALTLYQEAFNMVDYPLSKDYLVALQLSILIDDCDKFQKYAKLASLRGIPVPTITKHRKLKQVRKQSCWKTFLKEYPKLREQYFISLNISAQKTLKNIYSKDQSIRKYFRKNKNVGDTLKKIDRENLDSLNFLINQHGFPHERMTGFQTDIWLVIVLRHLYHFYEFQEYESFLLEQVIKGYITPGNYAYTIDHLMVYVFRKNSKYGTVLSTFKEYNEKDFKEFDKNRLSIGLEPLEVYKAKRLFNKKHKMYLIYGHH